jgi:hypothetical protein
VSLVEGEGCCRWNSRVTARDRYSRAESGPELASAIASAIISQALVMGALMPTDPNEQVVKTAVRKMIPSAALS